jgi:hypothetical protein
VLALQNLKYAVVLKQQSATNAATLTSDNIDTLGFEEVAIIIHGTTSDNATNNPSVLKLQQADTTDATNFADIAALVGDGASGFTIPSSPTATTTAPFCVMHLRKVGQYKRYLRLLISPTTTQTFSAIAAMSRAKEAPNSITEQNVAVAPSA